MTTLSPVRTVVTSFNPKSSTVPPGDEGLSYDEGDWVLCIAPNEVQNILACALSSGEILLYDRTTLRQVHSLDGGQSTMGSVGDGHILTEITFDTFDANVLATTSTDGSLKLFDIRRHEGGGSGGGPGMPNGTTIESSSSSSSAVAASTMRLPRSGEEALCLSFGYDGNIAAVGSNKGKIHFFDVRQTKQVLGTYNQSHTDEVTRLQFQPVTGSSSTPLSPTGTRPTTSLLLSGSEDGLACIFDTSQSSEETALQNILTVQAPIREVGFFGPTSQGVYCLTGSESMKLYHVQDSVCRVDFGMDLRSQLSHGLHQQILSGNTNINNTQKICHAPEMEYLVDCHWDNVQQQLVLLAGSSRGDAGIFNVSEGGIVPRHHLHGGHRGVIRGWAVPSMMGGGGGGQSFLTVGEDARMCEWNTQFQGTPGIPPIQQQSINFSSGRTTNRTNTTTTTTKKRSGTQFMTTSKARRARSRMAASPY